MVRMLRHFITLYCHSNCYNFIGTWIEGHKCPRGFLHTYFLYGYNLDSAKSTCLADCNARDDCYFADLYDKTSSQTCILRGNDCGDWQSHGPHESYHLFIKGIYQDLIFMFSLLKVK